jgi:hypothetical protein
MRVLATRLTETISITIAEDADGWRFVSWATGDRLGGEALRPPPKDAEALRFVAHEEALHYFRQIATAERVRP